MPKVPVKRVRAALELLAMGLPPVACRGKIPTTKGWTERPLSEDETRAAFQDDSLNVAVALHLSPFIDVECDSDEAELNLQAMFGGEIPPTPTWKSSRGLHRLFRRPEGLPDRAVIEIDGIEFRGCSPTSGALSIFPPSVHPDGPKYEWLPRLSLTDREPAELPQVIADQLRETARQPAPTPAADGDIPEGSRNDTLFSKACAAREAGLDEAAVFAAILKMNEQHCKPPLPEAEVRKLVHSAMTGEKKKPPSFLDLILREVETWHDQNDDPCLTLAQDGHRENWAIDKRSKPYRRWLSKKHFEAIGIPLSSGLLADYSAILEGKACFDGPKIPTSRRTASHDGRLYLDLCDEHWRAVEIDPDGWRVVAEPPGAVRFRRARAMHPLPVPIDTGRQSLWELVRSFAPVRSTQWPLVAAWLTAALRPNGPFPVLKLNGEQGSGKSTFARVLRGIIDPNAAPLRAEPRSTRDLMIAAMNAWILALDNLSVIKPDLSDALCRTSTGGGFATRTLYSDSDETIFDAMRPIILTSIEEIGARSDLMERSLLIELPPIPEDQRRPEKTFWREFEEARPAILGAMLDVVVEGLNQLPDLEARAGTDLPRMADFALWGEAIEDALGLAPGAFREAYAANQAEASATSLESNPVAAELLKYLDKHGSVALTATELLTKLSYQDGANAQKPGWPKCPRVLSAILKRLAPNLRQIGVVAEQASRGGGTTKEKIWRVVRQ